MVLPFKVSLRNLPFAQGYHLISTTPWHHLVQLHKLAYAIKNSPTIVLPRWKEVIKEFAASSDHKLMVRMMLRDVRTRWNSTYDMLKFALTYRDAIDKIMGERSLKLRDYELVEGEWELVMQLRDCLKVRITTTIW